MSGSWNPNCIEESNLKRVESAIRLKRKSKYSTFDKKWKELADKLKPLQNGNFDDVKKKKHLRY